MIRRQKGIVCLVTGIATVLIGYFAWGLLTVFHKSGSFGTAGFLASILTMLLYMLLHDSVVRLDRREVCRQLMAISGCGGLLSLLLLIRGGGALVSQGEYAKLGMNLLWLATFMVCVLFLRRHIKSSSDGKESKLLSEGTGKRRSAQNGGGINGFIYCSQ